MFGAVVYLFLAFILLWWGTDYLREALSGYAACPQGSLWAAVLLLAFAVAFLCGAVRWLRESESEAHKRSFK